LAQIRELDPDPFGLGGELGEAHPVGELPDFGRHDGRFGCVLLAAGSGLVGRLIGEERASTARRRGRLPDDFALADEF
jgi:hypothetical protein